MRAERGVLAIGLACLACTPAVPAVKPRAPAVAPAMPALAAYVPDDWRTVAMVRVSDDVAQLPFERLLEPYAEALPCEAFTLVGGASLEAGGTVTLGSGGKTGLGEWAFSTMEPADAQTYLFSDQRGDAWRMPAATGRLSGLRWQPAGGASWGVLALDDHVFALTTDEMAPRLAAAAAGHRTGRLARAGAFAATPRLVAAVVSEGAGSLGQRLERLELRIAADGRDLVLTLALDPPAGKPGAARRLVAAAARGAYGPVAAAYRAGTVEERAGRVIVSYRFARAIVDELARQLWHPTGALRALEYRVHEGHSVHRFRVLVPAGAKVSEAHGMATILFAGASGFLRLTVSPERLSTTISRGQAARIVGVPPEEIEELAPGKGTAVVVARRSEGETRLEVLAPTGEGRGLVAGFSGALGQAALLRQMAASFEALGEEADED
jgi:hypothetical protein